MQQHADGSHLHHNLPLQQSSFVGREDEIATISSTLMEEHCRLLTLVGMGGIGKTRLALAVASNNLQDYSDGVFFVNLQPINQPVHIISTILDALGYSGYQQNDLKELLIEVLQDKHLLLVLDNFEHLLQATELISEILQNISGVNLLVTSRELLNLREEWVHTVGGLSVPAHVDIPDIESYGAIRLFAERARQIQAKFDVESERKCVIQICQLVDGMPLSIELATAWLKTLPCCEILDSIRRNLGFLESRLRNYPGRHRSIQAIIQYSWESLTVTEQQTFTKLAVFWGSFSLEASKQIANANINTLSRLIEKSLIRLNSAGRYEMHELLRQFATEQLEALGEQHPTKDAHCHYYLNFLAGREPNIKGQDQLQALNDIALEMENIRIAWYWAVEQNYYELIDASMFCLSHFCQIRNRWLEGEELLRFARDQFASQLSDPSPLLWGRILNQHSEIKDLPGHIAEAEQALAIAQQHGNLKDQADSMLNLAFINIRHPIPFDAISYAQKSLAYYQTHDDKFMIAQAWQCLAMNNYRIGNYDKSLECWRQCCVLTREIGDQSGLALSLQHIGGVTLNMTGNYREVERYWNEAYSIRVELGQKAGIAASGSSLSSMAILRGDFKKAKHLAHQSLDMVAQVKGMWGDIAQWAHRHLGYLAIFDGDYQKAWTLFYDNQADTSAGHRAIYESELGMALAYCGLQGFALAKQHLLNALQSLSENHAIVSYTQSLPPSALLLAHEGEYERAVQLLALAFTYPTTHASILETWTPVKELKSRLRAELGDATYHLKWEEGTQLDLQEVVAYLTEYLRVTVTNQEMSTANQSLIESLSERELDVLQLIARGLSNREIAQSLIVTVGTVKKHNNNIFGKLHVNSRTQAVARARALKILS